MDERSESILSHNLHDVFAWLERRHVSACVFAPLESFIYIFLPTLRQNINESRYILTCESRFEQAPKRDWIRSARLVQKLLIKHRTEHHAQPLALILQRGAPALNELRMSSEVVKPEHGLWFHTYMSPHVWSPSNHWRCLIVNISYVCLSAASVSVVQGEASLSSCIRSHKVNKTLACVSSRRAPRMQSCVAFWLRRAIKKKKTVNATGGGAPKFPLQHCFLYPRGRMTPLLL